jgi:high affinity Mn2+ porin
MSGYSLRFPMSRVSPASPPITAVRAYTGRPAVSINLEQQISDTVGMFARAGWAEGNIEPWDFTE